MNGERGVPTPLELKQFRLSFEKVKYTPGLEVDLANSATDKMNGGKLIFSQFLPLKDGATINEALRIVAKEFVPVGAMETLSLRGKNGKKVIVDEWQTIDANVVFGISTEEDVKTWYFRNTEKKQNILMNAVKKLRRTP